MDSPCTSTLSAAQEQRHALTLKTIKEAMLELSATRNPSRSHSQQEMLEKHIDAHLPSLLPFPLRTPDHPPYSDMIFKAIQELNKKKGCTRTAISSNIKSKHPHLPLAHEHILAHHLENLVKVGKLISVPISLYKLPQQVGEQQLMVVGGEMIEREMSNCDVNSSALVPLPEKHQTAALLDATDSVDVDVRGGGMKGLPKKHLPELIEAEPMGGNVSGLKDLPAVIEVVKPLQEKQLKRRRGRPPGKNNKVEQQEKILELNETIPLTVGAVEQPRRKGRPPKKNHIGQQKQVAIEDTNGGLVMSLEKNQTAVIEMVEPLQKECQGCSQERTSTEKSEAEQLKEKTGKLSETITTMDAATNDDDGLASELEISPSAAQQRMHQNIHIKETCESKQQKELAMQNEEVPVMEEPFTASGTMTATIDKDCHPSSSKLIQEYQQQKQGNDRGGFLNDQFDCMNIRLAGQQQEIVKDTIGLSLSGAASDDQLASDIEISQERQQGHQSSPHEKHVNRQEEQELAMQNDEGSSVPIMKDPSMVVAVMKDSGMQQLQNNGDPSNPIHRLDCPFDEAEEKQEKAGEHSEPTPLMVASVDDDNLASEFEISTSPKQQGRQDGHFEKQHEDKQLQELATQVEDIPVIQESSTMAVMQDRECHPLFSNLKQDNQQQIQGSDIGHFLKGNHPSDCMETDGTEQQQEKIDMDKETSSSMAAVDEDRTSDFEFSESQEQREKRQSQDKPEEEEEDELPMQAKENSLVLDLKSPSATEDILKANHPPDCIEIDAAEKQQEKVEKVGETSSSMASVNEDVASDCKIPESREEQEKQESTIQEEELLLPDLMKSSEMGDILKTKHGVKYTEISKAEQETSSLMDAVDEGVASGFIKEDSLLQDLKMFSAGEDTSKADHPLECTEIGVAEQQQVRETRASMASVDEDLASDLNISESQEDREKHQSQEKLESAIQEPCVMEDLAPDFVISKSEEEQQKCESQDKIPSAVGVTEAVVKDGEHQPSILSVTIPSKAASNDDNASKFEVSPLEKQHGRRQTRSLNKKCDTKQLDQEGLIREEPSTAPVLEDRDGDPSSSKSREQQGRRRSRRLEKCEDKQEEEEEPSPMAVADVVEDGEVVNSQSQARRRSRRLEKKEEDHEEAEVNNSRRRSLRLARQSHQ